MKLNWIGRLSFFILSYYLLFIFIIYDNEQLSRILVNLYFFPLGLNWVLGIILTIIVILLTCYIFFWKNLQKKVFEITEIENLSAETLNYLVTIMLGLFFFNNPIYSMKILILVLLLYLIYNAGGIYYLQPILMLFGYKVYKCKIDRGNSIMIITKKEYISKNKTEMLELFEEIYLIRRK